MVTKTIKKGEIVEIEVVDADAKVTPKEVEKAANPPTIEMVLARLDQIDSKINENAESLKALKDVPKPPKKDEEEKEKDAKKIEEKPVEKPVEVVEKRETIDVVALIKSAVESAVAAKIGEQPIQKRSTAVPEQPKTFGTPMEIPAEILFKADVESIVKMGGYTIKGR